MNVYDFTVPDYKEQSVSLSDYKGKVLLIVNTATHCGYTPQYEGLEALYRKYRDQGFEILDFPSNQFMGQAPGSNQEIHDYIQSKYAPTFRMFAKADVNGRTTTPLYKWLKSEGPKEMSTPPSGSFRKRLKRLIRSLSGKEIKWNFTKFLVDRNGNVVARFSPTFLPEALSPHIEALLRG